MLNHMHIIAKRQIGTYIYHIARNFCMKQNFADGVDTTYITA